MKIFAIFVFILGGPGEAYVESRGIKVSWRPHHTGYIYVQQGKTMDNKFYIHVYVKTLTSLAKWGPGRGGGGGGGLQYSDWAHLGSHIPSI